jgi:hypothetical protein
MMPLFEVVKVTVSWSAGVSTSETVNANGPIGASRTPVWLAIPEIVGGELVCAWMSVTMLQTNKTSRAARLGVFMVSSE